MSIYLPTIREWSLSYFKVVAARKDKRKEMVKKLTFNLATATRRVSARTKIMARVLYFHVFRRSFLDFFFTHTIKRSI